MLCYAPTRCGPGCLYYKARDINLTALRYVAEAVRIRLFALRYTTVHGAGFWLCDIPLRIGAAQFKFNHPPLLNGR